MTVATLRKRLRAIRAREEKEWQAHKAFGYGGCLSSCPAAQRYWIATALIDEALAKPKRRTR